MDNNLLYIMILLLVINVAINWKDTSKAYYLDKGKKIGFTLNAIIILICLGIAMIILLLTNN